MSNPLQKIKRATYLRQNLGADESLRHGKSYAVPVHPLMVEIRPHQFVNHAAALEHKLINSGDELLPPT